MLCSPNIHATVLLTAAQKNELDAEEQAGENTPGSSYNPTP